LGSRKYYIAFTDDATCHTMLTILRSKDEALDAYKAYAVWVHTQHGMCIKCLHLDHGGKFTGGEFTKFLKQQGMEHQLTTHNTPQYNGIVESLNRCLIERICALLYSAGLPKMLWAEALHFVIWVKNRTLTQVLSNVTPFEKLTGNKPNISGVPK
jgi:transposase InsO family protein